VRIVGANSTLLHSEKIESTSGGDVKNFELLKKVCKSKIGCSSRTSESCDNDGNHLWSMTITNKDLSTWTFKTALCGPCSLLDVGEKHMENEEKRIEEEKQPSRRSTRQSNGRNINEKKTRSNGGEISHQPTAEVLKETTASQLLKTN
jgi:hypothetical protein